MTDNLPAKIDTQFVKTLQNSLYAGAKTESVLMVIEYCRHAKLDIMLKPVHIVPMWVVDKQTGKGEMRDVIMPGINLYRVQASRAGCAGISEPEFGEDKTECLDGVDITYPKWCRVTVKRIIQGHMVEFSARELWRENYATAGKDKSTGKMKQSPNAMWTKRPYGQLAKCTEAQALRKAFPEIGAMPVVEEMEGKTLDIQEYEELKNKNSNKGMEGLKQKLGMTKEESIIDIDNETGEVLEPEPESEPVVEQETNVVGFNFIKHKIENAKIKDDLEDALDLINSISDFKQKKELIESYKLRYEEFK